jgi:hypothetical protein
MAIVLLWQGTSGKPVPPNALWVIIAATLIIAAFLAWRKEWIASTTGSPVTVDPAEIVRPYMGNRTQVQADIYAKQYLGRRVRVRAFLSDVHVEDWWFGVVHLRAGGVYIHTMLPRWRLNPFLLLPSGAIVTVVGRIDEITALGIGLKSCQFVKAEEASDESTSKTPA